MNYVNGVPVEQLKVKQNENGEYEIEFVEKFDIKKSTQLDILDRLRENEIKCFPSIRKNYGIIILYLYDINDVWKVIDCLNIHNMSYEIDYNQSLITVDI